MDRGPAAEASRLALMVFLAGCGTGVARSEPGHFYVAGSVTGAVPENPRQTIANAPTPGATLHVVNEVDLGWGGQAAIGYALRSFRIEAEIGRTSNHSSRYSAISPIAITLPQSGKNDVTRYMANLYLEPFQGRWPISPYLGTGLGAAHGHATTVAAPARAPLAPPARLMAIADTRFAWQVIGGIGVPLVPHLALTGQFRWLDAGTFQGVDARGERATRTLHGSNVDLGVRYTF